ncbi:hypothetical protein EJ07DRAFT_150132 [Lizonia empirigonia]|nr:hypothetical protein EJ07DRAFT_150132 [Lizonia empirigonia]
MRKARESGCTLIQSRRGIYERKPRRQQARGSSTATELNGFGVGLSSDGTGNFGASQESNIQVSAPTELGHNHPLTAPARVLSQHDTSSGNADASINSKPRDASWSTVFENLLQRREYGEALVDKGSIAYVGEAFPLGIILDGPRNRTGRPLLHHPELVPTSETNTVSHVTTNSHGLLPEDIAFLEAKQTFTAPSDHTLDALIRLFLKRFFPFYPVVNPHELYVQHKARNIL